MTSTIPLYPELAENPLDFVDEDTPSRSPSSSTSAVLPYPTADAAGTDNNLEQVLDYPSLDDFPPSTPNSDDTLERRPRCYIFFSSSSAPHTPQPCILNRKPPAGPSM